MSTVFGMKQVNIYVISNTYSVKIYICKVLFYVNGVQADVIQ